MTFIRTAQIVVIATVLSACSTHAADKARTLTWDDLRPKLGLQPTQTLELNGDEALKEEGAIQEPMLNPSADATVPELNGKLVKIPAFIVPLDGDAQSLTELLLVPYFGACMHVPPPPPNQIIHVKPDGKGIEVGDLDLYNPVYVTGVLKTETTDHNIATIGYKMKVQKLEPYTDK